MSRTNKEWQALLDEGVADKCIAYIAGASEVERQSLAKAAEKQLRDSTKFVQESDQAIDARRRLQDAARSAALATCSLSTLKSLSWRIHPFDDTTVRILSDRRPTWLPEFAEHLLDGQFISWIPVRKLMRAGLISKPVHDNYVLGMTHHFSGVGGVVTVAERSGRRSVLAHLEEEPDLLEDVWRLFAIEGGGEYSLATHDKFNGRPQDRWDGSLVELSKRGELPRDRLLDESLAALDRGFAQFRVGWFSSFHELLEPTVEERVARQDQYLRLLASPIPPTVSFALNALEAIDKATPIPAAILAEGLRPVLLARVKGTAKSGLKFLERIAKREPAEAVRVARVATEALRHEASDVQAAAVKLIAATGDPADEALVEAMTAASSIVAASIRKPIAEWLASGSGKLPSKSGNANSKTSKTAARERLAEPSKSDDFESRIERLPVAWRKLVGVDDALAELRGGQVRVKAIEFDGTEIPRLNETQRIEPIQTVDELIDVAAAVVENSDDIDQIERLFDGVSRLCDQRSDDFEQRTGPLLKRLRDLLKRQGFIPFTGHDPAADVLGVLFAWLVGDYGSLEPATQHGQKALRYQFSGFEYSFYVPRQSLVSGSLAVRAQQLADRVKQQPAVATLCAPTHAGGWIDPLVLVERVGNKQVLASATDMEKVLALLRLAPDHRNEALLRLASSKDEFVSALRYALGAPLKKAGPTNWLWVAAARSRNPFADDVLVEDLGPDARVAAQASPKVRIERHQAYKWPFLEINVQPALPKDVDPRLVSVLMWKPIDHRNGPEFESVTSVRQLFQVRPLAQEGAFADGALAIGNNLDWGEAQWHNREYLQPLLDPDVPMKPMAVLLLLVGLAAKEPGEQGLATDVAIAAIDDGRLDGTKLGMSMAKLLPTSLIKAARWAKTLENVSRASLLHAEVVRTAITCALQGDPKSMPKDLHALVELFKELVVDSQSAVDESARKFLQNIGGSGKAGKAAKVILALKPEVDVERIDAVQRQVVESRVKRVERWCELLNGHD